jgi:hypothetical protein
VVQRGETYLGYSTYLGGPSSDYAYDIAVDKYGAAYITGEAGSGFPLVNPAQPYRGGGDAFVAKISPDGQTLVYATYIGGSYLDEADSIAVAKGFAYITGFTESGDFPTTPGAFQTANGHGTCEGFAYCADAFVVRLGLDGGSLMYSTFLGAGGADSGDGIAVDAAGNAYIMGQTNSRFFPVLNAVQPTYGGGYCSQPSGHNCDDAFVTKLNANGSGLIYSTYLGGNADEGFFFHDTGDIAIDQAGHAYITGYTKSPNFPTYDALQPTKSGIVDAYVTKLSSDGSAFVYSTFLGGTTGEKGGGIAADAAGNAYVTGQTFSDDFPTTPGAFQPIARGNADAFVCKLNPVGSAFGYSTFLGDTEWDAAGDIAVDTAGHVYVTGVTYSTAFPTSNAFQPGHAGGYGDAFVTKFMSNGNAVAFSSYLGGSDEGQGGIHAGADGGYGIALDPRGNAYVAGATYADDFPAARALQPSKAGSYDAFVTKVSGFLREPVTP